MNTAVYPITAREPYGLQAGLLTLAVHGLFFALLYLGFTWKTSQPPAMSVELWQALPEPVVAPPTPKIEEVAPPVPEKIVTPDIVLPGKQKKNEPKSVAPELDRKKTVKKPAEQKTDQKVARERAAREEALREQQAREQAAREQAAREQAARDRAEKEAATGKVIDEYRAKIMAKIRRNIVMPPNVADGARAEFGVTLLPGGAVLEARLVRSSGNAAYDSAVERAILKSDPLPLPPDASLFNKFRNLNLRFQPKE